MAIVHTVADTHDGVRLDQFLADVMAGWSRSRVQKLIAQGGVEVNGSPVRKRRKVTAGDTVSVDESLAGPPEETRPEPEDMPLEFLYEDEHVLAVNKPAGLVVHPGSGNRGGTLVNGLLHHCSQLAEGFGGDRPGIVHRLDRDTSGVILVAKTQQAHAHLAKQFQDREVAKFYLGVCIGDRPAEHLMIDAPIGRSRRDPTLFCVTRSGRPSQTECWLLGHHSGVAAFRFQLHTGRTHQIRVHLANRGFPIAADTVYGGDRAAAQRIGPLERPFVYRVLKLFDRQALHAHRIEFSHPATDRMVRVQAPVPGDMAEAFALLDVSIPAAQ